MWNYRLLKLFSSAKKLKTNAECLPSFLVPRNIATDVLKKVFAKTFNRDL